MCQSHLGVALRIVGSPEKALEHHRRAFKLPEPPAEVQMEIDFLHTYADTCRAAGRYDQALALLDRTIELARNLGRPHDEKLACARGRPYVPAAAPPATVHAPRSIGDHTLECTLKHEPTGCPQWRPEVTNKNDRLTSRL
jgi:tetratricopeptide (TPR) repeat protein